MCCQLLQNACKCSIYIRICFRIFICIYIRKCSCICDILRTFRHIALHFLNKMCTISKQEGAEKGKLCCMLIELSDLRINWHSNAKIDTN